MFVRLTLRFMHVFPQIKVPANILVGIICLQLFLFVNEIYTKLFHSIISFLFLILHLLLQNLVKTDGQNGKCAKEHIQLDTNEEDNIVPVVVRPGHIRFEPIEEGGCFCTQNSSFLFQFGTTVKTSDILGS